ncbi:MAG: recombinase family protein [Chloroflexi bacterium]|nr:recombinase family protein [Chloroflexota bacterium]
MPLTPPSSLRTADPRLARLSRIKPPAPKPEPGDLVRLALTRSALVYQRLSTHEQRRKSLWSIEMQEALIEQARADGYRDDQVLVERRDLGVSGTKHADQRPGLAHMIELIEADQVESVYVVHVSRLTRDQSLIDGLELGELFKRHGVVLVLPGMKLNLKDPMHMRLYRSEVERAADELELLKARLGGPRRHKSLSGRWDGRGVPAGCTVDLDLSSATHERYVPYPPHAEVVRAIFRAVIEAGTPVRAARLLRDRGIVFPLFPPEMVADERRSSLTRYRPVRVAGGIAATPALIRSIATNPTYLGIWLLNGQVVREQNHAPLVDADTFYLAQEELAAHGHPEGQCSGRTSPAPRMLAGLLSCARHAVPARMGGVARADGGAYQCRDGYDDGQVDAKCTFIDARVIDEPVADLVLNRCAFPEFADRVLAGLEHEYDAAREDARRREREVTKLRREITTLRENLAITHGPEEARILLDLISVRQARLDEVTTAHAAPTARTLTREQVAMVRGFLGDLHEGWGRLHAARQNDVLSLMLDRVEVAAEADHVAAVIRWRSGDEQRLWIERPAEVRQKARWTPDEDARLRAIYPSTPIDDLLTAFPDRALPALRTRARVLGVRREQTASPGEEGTPWTEAERAAIRSHMAGAISMPDLRAALPARSWDAILGQRRAMGYGGQAPRIYYRVMEVPREITVGEDCSRATSIASRVRTMT